MMKAKIEQINKYRVTIGDTVLDFTCGSGTSGVAAKNLNRDFICIELDEEYFKIAPSQN